MFGKKGENDFEFIYAYLEIEFMHILSLYKIREKVFESLYKKGEKIFGKTNFWFMYVSLTLFMHIYLFSFILFIAISYCLLLCMS